MTSEGEVSIIDRFLLLEVGVEVVGSADDPLEVRGAAGEGVPSR